MNFLNPFVLLGLAAASIPIILHLINLQRQKQVDFSTLKFLKELQQSSIRKLKLKQWLLLLLRTLLIIFAVMAFARPTINTVLPGLTEYSNSSMIFLLDNTYSMDVSDENGNRFRQAKKELNELINSLKEGDQAVIIPLSGNKPIQYYNWTNSRDKLAAELTNINIGTSNPQLEKSLKFASILFDEATNVNKQLFLISDTQKNIISSLDTNKVIDGNLPIVINHIGINSRKEFKNISIDSVNIISSIIQKNRAIEFEVFVTNRSNQKLAENSVTIDFDNVKVAQSTFTVAANESQNFILTAKANESGAKKIKISIENDEVLIDNNYYLTLDIPSEPNVIVYTDYENIFLKSVLDNLLDYNSITNYRFVNSIRSVSASNVESNNIVLVDKQALSSSDVSDIQKMLSNRVNVVLFSPTRNIEAFVDNSNQLKLNISKLDKYDPRTAEFSNYDKLHPLFDGVFTGEQGSSQSIESPKIMAELSNNSGRGIIETPSGNFLSEVTTGESTLLYFSIPLAPKWSNFVSTGLFPTLIYKSIDYLNSKKEGNANISTNSVSIPAKVSGSNKFEIVQPSGKSLFVDANKVGESYIIDIQDKSEFGNYFIYNNNKQLVAYYSVNHSDEGSNLSSAPKEKFVSELTNIGADSEKIIFVDSDESINDSINRARLGTELWQLFLILALLCGLTELIVQKHSKKS